jgi:hypothetical protein
MKWALAVLLATAPAAWSADSTFQGRFYWGHEVRSFQPCGSKASYWVQADEKTLQSLRKRAEGSRPPQGKPYRPIYLEATGVIDTTSSREGFARDHDGLFRLSKVARVSNTVPKGCRT